MQIKLLTRAAEIVDLVVMLGRRARRATVIKTTCIAAISDIRTEVRLQDSAPTRNPNATPTTFRFPLQVMYDYIMTELPSTFIR